MITHNEVPFREKSDPGANQYVELRGATMLPISEAEARNTRDGGSTGFDAHKPWPCEVIAADTGRIFSFDLTGTDLRKLPQMGADSLTNLQKLAQASLTKAANEVQDKVAKLPGVKQQDASPRATAAVTEVDSAPVVAAALRSLPEAARAVALQGLEETDKVLAGRVRGLLAPPETPASSTDAAIARLASLVERLLVKQSPEPVDPGPPSDPQGRTRVRLDPNGSPEPVPEWRSAPEKLGPSAINSPPYRVTFQMPMGELVAHYHSLVENPEAIILGFDKGCTAVTRFVPAKNTPIELILESETPSRYSCVYGGLSFSQGNMELMVLNIITQAEQMQAELGQAPESLQVPPQLPNDVSLLAPPPGFGR